MGVDMDKGHASPAGDTDGDSLQDELQAVADMVRVGRRVLAAHGTGALVRVLRHTYGHLCSALPAHHEVPVPPEQQPDSTCRGVGAA